MAFQISKVPSESDDQETISAELTSFEFPDDLDMISLLDATLLLKKYFMDSWCRKNS
ncbi:predicted protein [Sclerotinia sclerotiorum 1980 UF-70]|uniref:Uncharacterized protein n=2 Tax=Sclerotinia sclerotiorum (strain ATCC 18683 / 1980 / Ss-1) TaxID=665079 RepID=A7EA40_SCLS1|nr:predicted protein [Sclerotinia sclerotiorum 1980 UF-70]APA08476.1 hypothetical protein sscle_04g032460 [Sclerotinia sclerotiorum 1980 UF-70]EDN99318.1 predicted protein [Sclerotinia sclerotiorum 1980 UF-70]